MIANSIDDCERSSSSKEKFFLEKQQAGMNNMGRCTAGATRTLPLEQTKIHYMKEQKLQFHLTNCRVELKPNEANSFRNRREDYTMRLSKFAVYW